jgi:hypothetical protein
MRGLTSVILVAALLSACTSPQSLQNQPAALAFTTSVSLPQIRDCVSGKNGYITLQPFRDGWQFIQLEHGAEFAIFSLRLLPRPDGTRVEVRFGKAFGQATYEQAVRPCIDGLPRLVSDK